MTPERKLDELEATIRTQDADHEAKQSDYEARIAELTGAEPILDETDADRLLLLNRLEERMPDLDLGQREISWSKLDDGNEALVVDGGGFDGGSGVYFANAGDDVHAVGSIPDFAAVGCVVIRSDGSRVLARIAPTRWPARSRNSP